MNAFRFSACLLLLTLPLAFTTAAFATNSIDGSSITPSGGGSLVNSAGTWTFSSTTGSGGNVILLNGSSSNGDGVELLIANGGQAYTYSAHADWYEWSGSSWTKLSGTPVPLSANGATMLPSSTTDVVTSAGVWAFSTQTANGGNLIYLNGSQAGTGAGLELTVSGGNLYTVANGGQWFEWDSSYWASTSNPNGTFSWACASAVVVGLQWAAVSGATTYDLTRNGTSIDSSTALLYHADQGVAASTSYSYVLSAMDGSTTVSTQDLSVRTPSATPTGDPAYCPSTVITGMTWNWSTGFNQLNQSDLWNNTWGANGDTYLFFGDGGGFWNPSTGSTYKTSFGISELTGSAPAPGSAPSITKSNAVNVYGGYEAENASTIDGKVNDIAEIEGNFYGLGGIYESGDSGGPYGEPNHVEIVYSDSNAYSWVDNGTNWQFCSSSGSATGFCPSGFVQYGKGYAGAIDDYVYMLGATEENFIGNGGGCACTYLARVPYTPTNEILTYADYQVFTGFNSAGTPQWSSTWSDMQPIFIDNGSRPMNPLKMVYNSALKRFISVGQGDVNQAAFYDSPNPWGPFTTIAYYQSATSNLGGWGNLGTSSFNGNNVGASLGINFMNGWTSANGETMWATFSSNGDASSSADLVPLQGETMDSFSLVSVTLTVP